tara:strand:- start:5054 stop:5929 length:876 start_codon:yes stop_codon:yes gene_type:complete
MKNLHKQKIAWHYWCDLDYNSENGFRYIRYCLISLNSLIIVGKVNPADIYITTKSKFLNNEYGNKILKMGVNILEAPCYLNYSKQISYYQLIQKHPDYDKIVQIDTDTILTDKDIIEKIEKLDKCININWAGSAMTYNLITNRDGQKHRNNNSFCISPVKPKHPNHAAKYERSKYESFKDLLKIQFNADLDTLVEKTKQQGKALGHLYVLIPKLLSADFWRFMLLLNLFFQDDEVALRFAETHLNLRFGRLNNITHQAHDTDDFKLKKGIIHFPHKDEDLDEWAELTCNNI